MYHRDTNTEMSRKEISSAFLRIFRDCVQSTLHEKFATRRIIKGNTKSKQRAAVLVPITSVADCPSILFTVRNRSLRTHNGEVSFPGGKIDDDESIEEAAIRETYEELGIPTSHVINIGLFHDTFAKNGMPVTPVIGVLESPLDIQLSTLSPSETEVASVFALPVYHLLNPSNSETYFQPITTTVDGFKHPRGGLDMPRFLGGPEPIWGLTSYILDSLIKDVFRDSWNYAFRAVHEQYMDSYRPECDIDSPLSSPAGESSSQSHLEFLLSYGGSSITSTSGSTNGPAYVEKLSGSAACEVR